jgi:pentatricopeptide repeat protein
VTPLMLARMTDAIADASTGLSDGASRKWRLRVVASRLFSRAGRWDLALEQAKLAWQPGADAPAGAFLVRAYAQNGRFDDARRVLAETQARIDPGNVAYVQGMQGLREFVERMARKAATPPAPTTTPAG